MEQPDLQGSGVVVDPHVIVTNGHVVPSCDPKKIRVRLAKEKWIHPDAVECSSMRRFLNVNTVTTAFLVAVGYAQDLAFLIFKEGLQLPVKTPDWSYEDRTGKDVMIVGWGPHRKRLEGRIKLTNFKVSEFIRFTLASAGLPSKTPIFDENYLEIVTDEGVGVKLEPGDSGGALIDVETETVLAINLFSDTLKHLKKDYSGFIYVNSPTFRERVRMVNEIHSYAFTDADPVLKRGTERALLERKFLQLTDKSVREALADQRKEVQAWRRTYGRNQ